MTRILVLLILCTTGHANAQSKKMVSQSNLVAYWNFGQDPRFYRTWDQSGNGNHLSAINFTNDARVNAKVGQGILCNGGSQFFRLQPSTGVGHLGAAFSVLFWFRFEEISTVLGASIVSCNQWSVTTYDDSGTLRWRIVIDGKALNIDDVAIQPGVWYFISFGFHVGDGPSYIWGAVDADHEHHALLDSISTVLPGTFTIGGNGAHGTFDDFMIFRRSLRAPATEVTRIYNRGAGLPFEEWRATQECVSANCCQ